MPSMSAAIIHAKASTRGETEDRDHRGRERRNRIAPRCSERAGYEVQTFGKEPTQVRETGHWADVIVLAVPYGAVDDALRELGDGVNGKIIVDVTNALTTDMQRASGCTASGGETHSTRNLRNGWTAACSTVNQSPFSPPATMSRRSSR